MGLLKYISFRTVISFIRELFPSTHHSSLIILLSLLLPAALLINLGMMTFIDDEAIRALVALEMDLSGNCVVPTLNGEWYYNKPPLYNWILLAYFKLSGVWEEGVSRLATVVSLLGYAATIFWFFRKHFGARTALINALAFITCGRVLVWDSQLGLIDIAFSWVVFTGFMVVYHAFEKKQWYALFLITYALTAIGFLMKGLPSVVFQGFTLLAWFGYRRAWRQFFSPAHALGGLLFLLIVGAYYWQYSQYHTLEEIFPTLFSESSKRTALEYGWQDTALHLLTFPFEMVYHFLPWSLGVLFLLHKKAWQWLRGHPFVFYLGLIFAVNIVLYWSSVEVYPRYLLMHAPLLFGVFFYFQEKHAAENSLALRFLHGVWGAFMLICFVAAFAPFFWARAQETAGYAWKAALLTALLGPLLLGFWKYPAERVFALLIALLVLRIGFNLFVLPDRLRDDWGTHCRESSIRMGEELKDEPRLYIYRFSDLPYTNSFYLTAARRQILERKHDDFKKGDYIIIDPLVYPGVPWEPLGEIHIRRPQKSIRVGRLKADWR